MEAQTRVQTHTKAFIMHYHPQSIPPPQAPGLVLGVGGGGGAGTDGPPNAPQGFSGPPHRPPGAGLGVIGDLGDACPPGEGVFWVGPDGKEASVGS